MAPLADARSAPTGTSFTLSYHSGRMPGRTTGATARIPLSGATLPAGLQRIEQMGCNDPKQKSPEIQGLNVGNSMERNGVKPTQMRFILIFKVCTR
jgi:hypothetical protein